jgi:hypothetical protein
MKTACCNPLNATNSEPVQPPLANAAGPQGSAAFGQQAAMPSPTHSGPCPQRLAFSVGETAALFGVSEKKGSPAGQPETAVRITGVAPPLDSEKGNRTISRRHLLTIKKYETKTYT